MKHINRLTTIFLFNILTSCNSAENKNIDKQVNSKNLDTVVSTLSIDSTLYRPSLVQFEQDDCKDNNEKGEKILSKILISDSLIIKITSVQNCGTKYGGDFKFSGDTLDLIIKQLPKLVKHKNGKIDTIYSYEECYCLYKFSFVMNHVKTLPKIIMLNGEKFRGLWKGL